ncbi:MAG TPA: hypothetical protein VKF32_16185, partial [Thermoanaerobaculia bacterium]|nr:hypothetical protein [Thermoanaerobaculia bacterium]
MRRRTRRFTRSPNVACHWEGSEFVLEEFVSRSRIRVSHLAVSILDAFSEPCSLEEAARLFPAYTTASVRREMRSLARFGFLVPSTRRVLDAPKAWKGS